MKHLFRLALVVVVLMAFAGLVSAQDDLDAAMQAFRSAAPQFTASETVVEFQNEGQKIVGTLAVPEGVEGKLPIVLILHGFSGQRQELPIINTEEAMFSRTARIFAEQGYASLRIDFRGSGESEGQWADTTFSGQISDAIAALDYIGTLENMDAERIALLGLSQGGLVSASVAGRDSRVKSVILWSAVANPPITYASLLGFDHVQAGLATGDTPLTLTLPWGAETALKGPFFADIFVVNPVAAIASYQGPLMSVVGLTDNIVFPQPQAGQSFLTYHPGEVEKLVELNADHVFDILGEGADDLDDAIAWGLAWLQATL